MKTTFIKNSKKQQVIEANDSANFKSSSNHQPEHHSLLEYYKKKIDALCEERLSWLAKFDQCKSKLNEKHSLKEKLLQLRNQQRQLNRSLVHHNIALLDQKLNVIRLERENLMHDYRDAEEVIKIGQLMENYPQEIQKMLPCKAVNGSNAETIKNQLNIHNSKRKKPIASRSSKKIPPNSFNIKHSLSQKNTSAQQFGLQKRRGSVQKSQKITAEQLLQRQLVQLKRNQSLELESMQQLVDKLQEQIKKTKQQEKIKLNKQRQIAEQLNKSYKSLQKKHKNLAEEYFTGRRQQKTQRQNLDKEREQLNNKNKTFQEKVNKQLKLYEKQNKAKQILIVKKSQDFQQNYKAKMRAKQRNLQALKENYEKMQTICIQKVRKLQKALLKSKNRLDEAENRRQFLVDQLRDQLHTLQKRVQQQKNERQQRELKMKIRTQNQKIRNEQIKQKQEKQEARAQRNRLVQESYKRTLKANKSNSRQKSRAKVVHAQAKSSNQPRKQIYGKEGQQSEQDDSLQIDDLDNIRRQIGQLETKIAADTL